MIELRDVHKRFGEQVILDGVNFIVEDGETVALMGPSGTGKSVLLKHIIGLIRPDSGTVIVDGKEVGKLKRKELSELRSRIGYVFQNGALFDSMDVFENIRLGISDEIPVQGPGVLPEPGRGVPPAGEHARRTSRRSSRPSCRAACGSGWGSRGPSPGSPKYLLYDEPTSGLDPVNSDVIDELVKRLAERTRRHQHHGDARRARCVPHRRPAGAAHRRHGSCCRGPPRSSSPRTIRK